VTDLFIFIQHGFVSFKAHLIRLSELLQLGQLRRSIYSQLLGGRSWHLQKHARRFDWPQIWIRPGL